MLLHGLRQLVTLHVLNTWHCARDGGAVHLAGLLSSALPLPCRRS